MYFHKDSTVLLLLLSFLLCATLAAAEQCDSCVRLSDNCYNKTHLLDFQGDFRNEVVITKLGILYSQKRLYYAFEPKISDPEYYKVGFVNLISPETQGVIKGNEPVTNFRTFDIDQKNEVIYLGSGNGIYKLNLNKQHITDHFSSRGDTIEDLVFKVNVYFIRYGENVIIEKENDEFKRHEKFKTIKKFVIDKNGKVVYLNNTGLYASSKIYPNDNDIVRLSKNNFFRGITTDINGDVYAWWIDGIYKVELKSNINDSKVVKIADISEIGAVTFDKDNKFLFSSGKALYRLDPLSSDQIC